MIIDHVIFMQPNQHLHCIDQNLKRSSLYVKPFPKDNNPVYLAGRAKEIIHKFLSAPSFNFRANDHCQTKTEEKTFKLALFGIVPVR